MDVKVRSKLLEIVLFSIPWQGVRSLSYHFLSNSASSAATNYVNFGEFLGIFASVFSYVNGSNNNS